MTIYPTGRCFDDTAEFLDALVARTPAEARRTNYLLAHGILLAHNPLPGGPLRAGERYAHAWVEKAGVVGTVIHAGRVKEQRVYIYLPLAEWYALHLVEDVTRYTLREVWEQNQRQKTYGLWEPKYLALCRDRRTGKLLPADVAERVKGQLR